MTALTMVQVADFWIGAGGPKSRAVEWVAIAMGESSLEYDVVSSAGAIGLWQIMPFNAGPYGYTVANLYDPAINARIAVAMSGGGVNCAAWDSCYRDIYASGRYAYLAWPEQGSADWNNLPAAQAGLAGHGLTGMTNPVTPGMPGSIDGVVANLNRLADVAIPALTADAGRLLPAINASFRRGWRP